MRLIIKILLLVLAAAAWVGPMNAQQQKLFAQDADHVVSGSDTIVRHAATREQRALRRVLVELDDLRTLIAYTSQLADPDARIRFDYSALLADLGKIEAGIDSHLTVTSKPRQHIKPIRGLYSR